MIGPDFRDVLSAADDLASETWLGVIRGIDRFQGDEPAFRAWVVTIARHEVLDRRRRAARRATENLPPDDLADLVAPDNQAEAIVLRVVAGLGSTGWRPSGQAAGGGQGAHPPGPAPAGRAPR